MPRIFRARQVWTVGRQPTAWNWRRNKEAKVNNEKVSHGQTWSRRNLLTYGQTSVYCGCCVAQGDAFLSFEHNRLTAFSSRVQFCFVFFFWPVVIMCIYYLAGLNTHVYCQASDLCTIDDFWVVEFATLLQLRWQRNTLCTLLLFTSEPRPEDNLIVKTLFPEAAVLLLSLFVSTWGLETLSYCESKNNEYVP